jgi:hypothetical protein
MYDGMTYDLGTLGHTTPEYKSFYGLALKLRLFEK